MRHVSRAISRQRPAAMDWTLALFIAFWLPFVLFGVHDTVARHKECTGEERKLTRKEKKKAAISAIAARQKQQRDATKKTKRSNRQCAAPRAPSRDGGVAS